MNLFETIFDEVIEEFSGEKNIDFQVKEELPDPPSPREEATKPHIIDGKLIIPMNSDPKYHWWNGGQSLKETLEELNAPPEVMKQYVGRRFE